MSLPFSEVLVFTSFCTPCSVFLRFFGILRFLIEIRFWKFCWFSDNSLYPKYNHGSFWVVLLLFIKIVCKFAKTRKQPAVIFWAKTVGTGNFFSNKTSWDFFFHFSIFKFQFSWLFKFSGKRKNLGSRWTNICFSRLKPVKWLFFFFAQSQQI